MPSVHDRDETAAPPEAPAGAGSGSPGGPGSPSLADASLVAPQALVVMATVLVVASFLVVGGLVQLANAGFGSWFTEVFLFLGIPWVLTRASGRDPVRSAGLVWPGLRPVAVGLGAGAFTLLGIAIPLLAAWSQLFPESVLERYDMGQLFEDRTWWELALVVSSVCLAAPFCEEYFFRGVVQGGITRWWKRGRSALVVTALLFAVFHLNPVAVASLFVLGLVFGGLFGRTGSLWPAIAAHAGNNGTSTLLYFLGSDAETADKAPNLVELAWISGVGVTGLLLLAWLVQRRPVWLPHRELPDVPHGAQARSLYAWAAPWIVAGMLSLAAFLALDHRGVALNFVDLRTPVGKLGVEEKSTLQELRRRARRGEVPLEEYEAARRARALLRER